MTGTYALLEKTTLEVMGGTDGRRKGWGGGRVLPKDPKSLESEPDSHLNLLCDLEQGT